MFLWIMRKWIFKLICFKQVKTLLKLYAKEKYILVVNQQQPIDFEVFVSFKVRTWKLLLIIYEILIFLFFFKSLKLKLITIVWSHKPICATKLVADLLALWEPGRGRKCCFSTRAELDWIGVRVWEFLATTKGSRVGYKPNKFEGFEGNFNRRSGSHLIVTVKWLILDYFRRWLNRVRGFLWRM